MDSKTQGKLRRKEIHREIGPLPGHMNRVLRSSRLKEEKSLQVNEETIPREAIRPGIADSLGLAKPLTQDQEKFELLNNYVNDLIGIIFRLEDQLKQSSNTGIVGKTMVAGLVHDLRNPMAVISSCAQFCLENEKLTPLAKRYLRMIRENGKTATKLLNQFLDFSKVNLTFKSLNLNQILEKAWQWAELDSGFEKISFKAHLAEDLPEIFGDPDKIERIFLNLFLNAIQAASLNRAEGIVTVQTRLLHPQDMAEVIIVDDGPGVPEEIQGQIFQPFFTTKKGGTGLGLHLCRYFVEQHKGRIAIERALKGGTKVSVWLPITRAGTRCHLT